MSGRDPHQGAVADRAVRLVLVAATLGALVVVAVLVLLVVLSALFPDTVHWLLGDEPLLD